ncbi:MAG: hypothetical protein U1E20_02215 [Methylocystis sp.]|uniref:hypothetical protein n=1 Tax=Methylocystis sp. TaxID=1911079 RepID=UPI00394F20D5
MPLKLPIDNPMDDGLLTLASETAGLGRRNSPLKRRAVSTAYYAVFHAVAKLCADELLPGADRGSEEFEKAYRALEHSSLKRAAQNFAPSQSRLREIGNLIAELQSERHKSDYLPIERHSYSVRKCSELIDSARIAMQKLRELDASERRILVVALIFKNRSQ